VTLRGLAAVLVVGAATGAAPATAPAAVRPPSISAPAAVLVEASTGERVYARRAGQERAIASTTKLMTVYVALRRLPLTRTLTAPAYPVQAAESQIGLRAGERMTVADLVRAVMLPSANDAANALAVRTGHGSRAAFVAAMNREARRLGLRHTHYTTPVGLDTPGNYSTAADLARLAVAVRKVPFLRRTMDLRRAVLRSGDHPRVVVNRNTVVDDVPWANGVKTGHTNQAGYVLVGSGTRHGLTFVSAVLGTASEAARDADSLALLRWGFAHFRVADVLRRGAVVGHAGVRHDADRRVALVAGRSVRRLIARGRRVRLRVAAPRDLAGPLPRGAVVGRVTVRAGGRVIGAADVLTRGRVPAVGVLTRGVRAVGGPATLVLIVAIGALLVTVIRCWTVVRRRRRAGRPGPETA
jgi:serine-type D-Ala-D-Ala carboxypeptidase (penicillin-binding protein 5/6)